MKDKKVRKRLQEISDQFDKQGEYKKLLDQFQENSNVIYRSLIDIKEKLSDIDDQSGIQDCADQMLSEWQYLDNAIFNARAEWNEIK